MTNSLHSNACSCATCACTFSNKIGSIVNGNKTSVWACFDENAAVYACHACHIVKVWDDAQADTSGATSLITHPVAPPTPSKATQLSPPILDLSWLYRSHLLDASSGLLQAYKRILLQVAVTGPTGCLLLYVGVRPFCL